MASPTLQFKRGLFVNLPALRAGEPGFTTDKNDLYIGIGGTQSTDNKFFGSHRYWEKETGTDALKLRLVDKDGSNSIGLRAPATLADSNTVYTLPSAPTDGYFLKTNSTGELEWSSVTAGASFDGATLNNTSFTGISTFSGAIDANAGLDVSGGSTFDNINVTGVGTITTADINGGNIDGTVIGASSAAAGTFTELAYNNSSTSGISTVGSLYVGSDKVLSVEGTDLTLSNIDAIDEVTRLTLEAALSLDPNDFNSLNVTGIGTFGGLLDAKGGLDVTGHAELDTLNVSGLATFAQQITATGGIVGDLTGVASTATKLQNARDFSVSGDVATSAPVSFDGTGNVSLAVTLSNTFSANTSGIITATGGFSGDLTGNVTGDVSGNAGTATSLATARNFEISGDVVATAVSFDGSGNVNLVATIQPDSVALGTDTTGDYVASVTGTTNQISVSGSGGETAAVVLSLPDDVVVGTSLSAPTVKTATIQHSGGAEAITIDAGGNVGVSTNLTVTGNLNVLGSTTTINTETLLVKDSLIEVGLVDSAGALVPPTADANIDVGMIFHYYVGVDGEGGSAKTAAVYWDDSVGRIKVASEVTESNSVLTAAANGALEIGGLYVAGCEGSPVEVIGCVNGEVTITNAVIDGGVWE
jgi:hypothetical protein